MSVVNYQSSGDFEEEQLQSELDWMRENSPAYAAARLREKKEALRKEKEEKDKKREAEKRERWESNRPYLRGEATTPPPADTERRAFTAAETNAVLTDKGNRMVTLTPEMKEGVKEGNFILIKEGKDVFLQETRQNIDMRQAAELNVYQAQLASVAPGDVEGQKTELKRQAELGEGIVRGVGLDYFKITEQTYGEAIPLGGLSKAQIFEQADLGGALGYMPSTQFLEEAGFMTSAMIPRWEDLEMEFMPATSAAVSGEAIAQALGRIPDPSLGEFDINIAPQQTIQAIEESILQREYASPSSAAKTRKDVVFGQYLDRNYQAQYERHLKAVSEFELYPRGTDAWEKEFKSIIPYSRALAGEPGIFAYNPYEEVRTIAAMDLRKEFGLGASDPNLTTANFLAADKTMMTVRVTSTEQIEALTISTAERRLQGPTFEQEMFSAGLTDFWDPKDFLMLPALAIMGATNPAMAAASGAKLGADIWKAGGEFKRGLKTDPMKTYKDTFTPRLKGQLIGVAVPIGMVGRFGKAGGAAARAMAFYVDPLEQLFAEGITPVIKYGGGIHGRRLTQKVGGQWDVEESLIYGTAAVGKAAYVAGKDVLAAATVKGFDAAYIRGIGAPRGIRVDSGPSAFKPVYKKGIYDIRDIDNLLESKTYKKAVAYQEQRTIEKNTVKAEIAHAKAAAKSEKEWNQQADLTALLIPGAMGKGIPEQFTGQFAGPSRVIKSMEKSSKKFESGRFDKPLFKDDDKYLGGGITMLAAMKTVRGGTTLKRQYAEGKVYESTAGPNYQKLQKQMEAKMNLEMPTPSSFEQAIDLDVSDYDPKMPPMLELPTPKVFEPKQFEGMPEKFNLESGFTSMKPQLERLEQRFEGLESRNIERAMTKMETPKLKGFEQKFKTDTKLETEIERRGKEFEKRNEINMKKKLDIEIPGKGPTLPKGGDMMKKIKMPDFSMKEISKEFEYKLPKNLDARFNRALGGK